MPLLNLPTPNRADAHQGGLFDMMGDDAQGASSQAPELPQTLPWGIKERLMQEKTAVGFTSPAICLMRWKARCGNLSAPPWPIWPIAASRNCWRGIVSDLRVINGQRGKLVLVQAGR